MTYTEPQVETGNRRTHPNTMLDEIKLDLQVGDGVVCTKNGACPCGAPCDRFLENEKRDELASDAKTHPGAISEAA